MTERDDGGPAFPGFEKGRQGFADIPRIEDRYHVGMTLRDWLAGQIIAAMHTRDGYDSGLASPEQRAKLAYIDADAMIAQRKLSR